MIYKKLLPVIIVIACSGHYAIAQNVISFMGGTLQGANLSLSFSAGEAVSGTFSNSSINLTGGFPNGSDLVPTSAEDTPGLPKIFRLNQNYPNPFNPSTNIAFDLPKTSHVLLEVYNSIGAKVATLIDGNKSAGSHIYRFNAARLASGMYFYRLTAEGKIISTKKMILIK